MTERLFLFVFFTFVVLSCTRCKEECTDSTNPDCPNYVPPTPADPCAGSREVSADFTIGQRGGPSPAEAYFIETTGAVCGGGELIGTSRIRLFAMQDGLNYKWIVGADTIHEREYIFEFGSEFCGASYPIKLIVSGTPDSICFPHDNGMDTVVKTLPVIHFEDNPIFGTYRVAFDSAPNDSFLVKLSTHLNVNNSYDVYAHNFSNLGSIEDSCRMDIIAVTNEVMDLTINTVGFCRRIRGRFRVNPNDTFEAEYQMDAQNQSSILLRKVRGRRIN